jgi:hypothetical protein
MDQTSRDEFEARMESEFESARVWGGLIIDEVITRIPEFQAWPFFDRWAGWVAEDKLVYPFMDTGGLFSFIMDAVKRDDSSLVKRCFAFLDELAARRERDVDDLMYITFFENLDEEGIEQMRPHMGVHLTRLADSHLEARKRQ